MANPRISDNPGIQRMPADEREWRHFINEFSEWIVDTVEFEIAQQDIETAQTTADGAQASADTAQTSADSAQTTADGAQTDATQALSDASDAQTTADNAAHTVKPFAKTGHQWQSDSAGVFTPGDPTETLGIRVVDKNDVERATRRMDGQLTSAAGTIDVSPNSDTADPGYSTSFVIQADNTANPRADITITFPDGTTTLTTMGWGAIDASAASSIPGGGGGK